MEETVSAGEQTDGARRTPQVDVTARHEENGPVHALMVATAADAVNDPAPSSRTVG